jgi:hypothetical protein
VAGNDWGNVVFAAVVLVIFPFGLLIFAATKLWVKLPRRARFINGEWEDAIWTPHGRWTGRYGVEFMDFRSSRMAMGFGFLTIAKMLVVGLLIGLLSGDEVADMQAACLLFVEIAYFALTIIFRPFSSLTENLAEMLAELAGFLPLIIAVFASTDEVTCTMLYEWEVILICSAFAGIIAQLMVIGHEFLPIIVSHVKYVGSLFAAKMEDVVDDIQEGVEDTIKDIRDDGTLNYSTHTLAETELERF